jgi:NAD(P)-dependent dehydrogenase (short-subunit alcohol dehydrogenase family)
MILASTLQVSQPTTTIIIIMNPALGFQGTHALLTGGADLIGEAVVEAFHAAGATVTSIDINQKGRDNYLRPRLLEMRCDITGEEASRQCIPARH